VVSQNSASKSCVQLSIRKATDLHGVNKVENEVCHHAVSSVLLVGSFCFQLYMNYKVCKL
jgi:hypothetical protein